MSTHTSGWRLPPVFTTARLTLVLVVAAVGGLVLLLALAGFGGGWATLGYLAFVLLTAGALHRARQKPGTLFARQAVRRVLVLALLADCAAFVGQPPGAFPFLVVALVLLNVALGWATLGVASAPDAAVDERQEALRNRSHRIAYWTFALLVGGTFAVARAAGPSAEGALVSGGAAIAFFELLFVLPGMVVAWLEPDHLAPETAPPALDRRSRLALGMLGVAIAWPALLSVGLVVLPVRTDSTVRPVSLGPSDRCVELMATSRVGLGVEAKIPVHATACGDGRTARAVWGLNQSDCQIDSATLATVGAERCDRTIGPDGTLRFTYGAVVRPSLLPFLRREVTVRVVVDRDGRVVQFP